LLEPSLGEFAQHFEFPNPDLLREHEAPKPVRTVVKTIAGVVAAEPMVSRVLALDRECAAAEHLALEEEVDADRGRGRLRCIVGFWSLPGSANGQQVLVAIIRAVQVVAALRVPEVDLNPSRGEDLLPPRRRGAVEDAARGLQGTKVAPVDHAVVASLKD